MNRIVGPNPSNRFCHHGAPVSSGSAFTTTPLLCSSFESWSVFANAGISVRKFVVGFSSLYFVASLKAPWIAVPFDVMSFTCPARTSLRKNGLYGTRTRDCACVARELA
jgi:hypothetical protein